MTRVALIYAFNDKTYYRSPYPSVGLGYLSSFLKNENIDVIAIDAKYDELSLNYIKQKVEDFSPDLIGFTAMTHEITNAAKCAIELKSELKESKFLIGGAHATVAAERTLNEYPVFDIAVIGEGEQTLLELAKLMDAPVSEMHSIKGIAWRSNDEIIANESRDPISNLDSIPFPDYSHILKKIDKYPILTSRGCPNRCIFCCRILGNRIRVRSPQNVVEEIKFALERFGPKLFDICDDTFTVPKKRALDICKLLIKEGFNKKIMWTGFSRVNGIDQTLFFEMKEAGCINVDFGVESGNQEILNSIKKDITISEAKSAIKMAKKAGLNTGSYYILGHPFETVHTVNDTIKLAAELNTTNVAFGIMVPYPGTGIYEMALKGDGNYKLISENWEDYDKQIGNALELSGLSRNDLEKLQRKAYLTFYLRNGRYSELTLLLLSQRDLALKMIKKTFSNYF